MSEKKDKIDRRLFMKTAGAAGFASALAGVSFAGEEKSTEEKKAECEKETEPKLPRVPRRKLGKTGVEVAALSLGAMFDVVEYKIILRNCLKWGVDYWDTAPNYAGGNSEVGIGDFLKKNPDVRKKLFIVTKASGAKNPKEVEERLKTSLERMNTNYIDMYYGVHAMRKPSQLTDELKQWVKSAKERKLIRFFGFSTHSNMADCLAAAAKLDWIDAAMPTYNFRVMQEKKMQAAMEACHKAGIAVIAMKTQANGQEVKSEEDKKLAGHFLAKGFTQGQARIKAVLSDKRICSACVQMRNVGMLMENVAAVLDKTKLTQADMAVFAKYAAATCSGYCAGCANICERAAEMPYLADVMRCLMYYNSYGEPEMAREYFSWIPAGVKRRLAKADYSLAEARCPQGLPIARFVAEAVTKLA
jgi:predicted aldo/keto reductase-like oxidoreductase